MEDDRDPIIVIGGRKKWANDEDIATASGDTSGEGIGQDPKVHDLSAHYRRSMAPQSPMKGAAGSTLPGAPNNALPPQFPFSVHAYDVSGGANASRTPAAPQYPAPRAHRATVAFTPNQLNAAKNRDFSGTPTNSATPPVINVPLETTSGSGTKPQQTLHGSPYVAAVLLSLWDFSSGPRPEQVWVSEPSALKNPILPNSTAASSGAREDWSANQVMDLADSSVIVSNAPPASYHIHITDHQFLGPKSPIEDKAKLIMEPPVVSSATDGKDGATNDEMASSIMRSTSPSTGSHTSPNDTISSLEGAASVVNPSLIPLEVAEHEHLRGSLPPSGALSTGHPNTIPIIAPSTKVTKLIGTHHGSLSRRGGRAASDLDLAGSFGFEAEEDESLMSEMIDENYVAKKNPVLKKSLAARLKNAPRVVSSHPKHAKTNTATASSTLDSDGQLSPKSGNHQLNQVLEITDSSLSQSPNTSEHIFGEGTNEHGEESEYASTRKDGEENRTGSTTSMGSLRRRSYSLTGDSSSRSTRLSQDNFLDPDGDERLADHYTGRFSSSSDDSEDEHSGYSSSSSDAWDDEEEDGEDDSHGAESNSSSSETSESRNTVEESVFASGDIMAIASHVAKYTLGSDLAELVSSPSVSAPAGGAAGIMMDPWNITSNNQSGHSESAASTTGDGASHPVGSTLSNVFGGGDDDFGFFGDRNGTNAGGSGTAAHKREGSGGNNLDKNSAGGLQGASGGLDGTDPNGDPNANSSTASKIATGEDDTDAVDFLGIEHKLHVFESAPYFTLSAVFTAPYNVKITGPSSSGASSTTSGIASLVEGSQSISSSSANANAPTFSADATKFAFSLLLPKETYENFSRHYAALIDRLNQWVVLYVYLCQLRPQQALPLIHKEVVRTVMQMNRLLGCEGISLPSLKNTLFALARPNSHDSASGSFNSSAQNPSAVPSTSPAGHPVHSSSGSHLASSRHDIGADARFQGGHSPFSAPSSPMPSHHSHALPSHLNYMHNDFMSGDESSFSTGTGPSLGQSFSPSSYSGNPLDGNMTSPTSSFGDIPHFYGDGFSPNPGFNDRQYRASTSITSANSPNLAMSTVVPSSPRGATPREFELPGHGQLSASSPAVPSAAAPIPIAHNERSGSASSAYKEVVSSSTSWIEEPKKVRDFLALVLTSHFQTHQRTVILGEDLELVNLFVSTLSLFLSPEDRYVFFFPSVILWQTVFSHTFLSKLIFNTFSVLMLTQQFHSWMKNSAKSRLATYHNIPVHLGGKTSAPQRNRAPTSNTPDAPFVATFFPGPNGNTSLQSSGTTPSTSAAPTSGKLSSSTKETTIGASTMTTLSTAGFGISAPTTRFSAAQSSSATPSTNTSSSSSQAPFIASVNVPATSAPSPSAADFRHLRRDARRESQAPPVAPTTNPSQSSTPPVSSATASSQPPSVSATQWHFIHQHFYMDGYVPDLTLQGVHGNAKLVRNSAYIQGSMPVTLVDLNRRSVTQTHPFHQFRLLRCEFHQAVLYKLLRVKKTNLWNTQETLFQQVKDSSAIVRKLVMEAMRLPEPLIMPYISISLKNLMSRTYTLVKYVEGLEQGSPGMIEHYQANAAAASVGSTSSGDGKAPTSGKGSKDSASGHDKDKSRLPNNDKNSAGSLLNAPVAPTVPPVPAPSNAYYASGPALPSHSDPFADIQFNDSHISNPRYGARSRSGSSSSTSSAVQTPQVVPTPTPPPIASTEGLKVDHLPSPHSYASLTSIFASPPPNLFHHHHHHLYQHNHATYSAVHSQGMALGEIRTNPSLLKRIRHDLDLDDSCFNVLLGLAELLKPGIFRALFGDPMSQEKKWIELFEGL